MIDKYNTTSFTPWRSVEITNKFKIGGVLAPALRELGAIKTEYGSVKLTEKMLTLRPSTVRKRMNQIANANYVPRRNRKQTNVVNQKPDSNREYNYMINLVRTSVREELKDLFSRLSS